MAREGPVEGRLGIEATVEGELEQGGGLGGVGEPALHGLDPLAVQEVRHIEVERLVDCLRDATLGLAQSPGKVAKSEAWIEMRPLLSKKGFDASREAADLRVAQSGAFAIIQA